LNGDFKISGADERPGTEPLPVAAPPTPLAPTLTQGQKMQKKAPWLAALLFVGAKIKSVFMLLFGALKFLKLGKILLTSGTMLVSIVLYSYAFGWPFAVGFVLTIFVHEMGHVYVGWRQGLPMSAPVFIPFMGAVIFNKRGSSTAWGQAIMGIGGPVAGSLAGLACWGIYGATGSVFFLVLAYVTFWMNLFNLTPIVPLDGGWITGAVSPYLWLIGVILMVVHLFTGSIMNPLIIVLILMSLPRLWHGLRTGEASFGGVQPASPTQRWIMGACYVGLGAFLFACMAATNVERRMQPTTHNQVAVLTSKKNHFLGGTPTASIPAREECTSAVRFTECYTARADPERSRVQPFFA
jgi:Zn-dependent protease